MNHNLHMMLVWGQKLSKAGDGPDFDQPGEWVLGAASFSYAK